MSVMPIFVIARIHMHIFLGHLALDNTWVNSDYYYMLLLLLLWPVYRIVVQLGGINAIMH
jgi:hypothetical protein